VVIHRNEASGALETTLSSLDLRADAAVLIASMKIVASALDDAIAAEDVAKLSNTLMRQLAELQRYTATPVVADPFDELARALASGGAQ
jgi:hypothetical protein